MTLCLIQFGIFWNWAHFSGVYEDKVISEKEALRDFGDNLNCLHGCETAFGALLSNDVWRNLRGSQQHQT